jgi:hypothetical protein
MFNKINVIEIVEKHLSTLINQKTKKIHVPDVVLFILLPLFLSLVLIYFHNLLNKDIANVLVTSFSIFAGLLLNLLLIVFDLVDKQGDNKDNIRNALKELYFNISFCILISILSIFLLLALFININSAWYLNSLSFLVYYFFFVFMFTFLMVLKRIHKMLSIKFTQ